MRMPRPRSLFVLPLLLLVTGATACADAEGGEGAEDLASEDSDIVAGERSGPADDAVVHVYAGHPCSGVLVGPSLVMTALHCVARDGGASASASCASGVAPMSDLAPPSAVRVSVGSTIFSFHHYGVKAIVTSPTRRLCNGDVAVLVLSEPVTEVSPLAVRTSPIGVGSKLTAIGWGVDGRGMLPDFRRKRSGIRVLDTGGGTYARTNANGTFQRITAGSKEIVTGESICQGDSGGPLLDSSRRVAALVSRVQTGCTGSLAIHSDVSYWDDLLDQARTHL